MTLDDTALAAALTRLSGWGRVGRAIEKTYSFPDFRSASSPTTAASSRHRDPLLGSDARALEPRCWRHHRARREAGRGDRRSLPADDLVTALPQTPVHEALVDIRGATSFAAPCTAPAVAPVAAPIAAT